MNWFKRRKKDSIPPAPYTLSDSAEKAYREEQIKDVAFVWGESLAYTAERLDKWVIREASGATGDDPLSAQFIPHPLWDTEWLMTRSSYPTYEQAEAHVNRIGGTLLKDD